MSEHFRKEGLYVIRPSDDSSGAVSEDGAKWSIIESIIEDYTRVHPREMRECIQVAKMIRESSKQESKSLRWGFRIPPGLLRIIERRFPDAFTSTKNVSMFMKKFPGFNVCEPS